MFACQSQFKFKHFPLLKSQIHILNLILLCKTKNPMWKAEQRARIKLILVNIYFINESINFKWQWKNKFSILKFGFVLNIKRCHVCLYQCIQMKKTPKCKYYFIQQNDVQNPFAPHLHTDSKLKWQFKTIIIIQANRIQMMY